MLPPRLVQSSIELIQLFLKAKLIMHGNTHNTIVLLPPEGHAPDWAEKTYNTLVEAGFNALIIRPALGSDLEKAS